MGVGGGFFFFFFFFEKLCYVKLLSAAKIFIVLNDIHFRTRFRHAHMYQRRYHTRISIF